MKTLLTILLLAAMPASADTITTISGSTYSDASVTKTTPTAISINHSTGMAKIPFKDLPAATQKKYGYDPAKAAEYEAQEGQRQAEQKQRADALRLQAEQENAEREHARLAKEQAELAQEQAGQRAAAQAEQEAKKKLLSETTPLILIKSDPKPGVPFWIKAEMQIETFYGVDAYEDARESHFAFELIANRAENIEIARGFMRRAKGEAVRQAIASKGGRMKAIIKGVYLPEMFDPRQSYEFEILEVVEQ
jgi:hypothetical protein